MSRKLPRASITRIVCALAACGASTAFAQATRDPCALLTPSEVSGVLGMSVGPGQPIGTTGCMWETGSKTRATVTLGDASGFASMKAALPQIKKDPVAGIGDDAFYATVGPLTTLSVKKGKDLFIVRLYGVAGQARQMEIEKNLAVDILARL
jgi:hypothetical protein